MTIEEALQAEMFRKGLTTWALTVGLLLEAAPGRYEDPYDDVTDFQTANAGRWY